MRSLGFRLALLACAFGLLQALAVLIFSYLTIERSLETQTRRMLSDKLVEIRELIDEERDFSGIRNTAHKLVDLLAGHEDLYVAVAKPTDVSKNALVLFTPVAAESLRRMETGTWDQDAFLEWRMQASDKPMLSATTASEVKDGSSYVVLLTADRTRDKALLRQFLLTALTGAPIALGVVGLGAWFVVTVALRSLNRIRDAAINISTKNMDGRIDPTSLPNELIPLANALNEMFDRLADGIARLSQYSGDLAHEMRTPLSILLGRTQVTLSQNRTKDELSEVLENNVFELEQLTRLVSDMLFLAQADEASEAISRNKVLLDRVAANAAEFIEMVADERQMTFRIEGQGVVDGDERLITRAVANLLSNAVRYGLYGSEIMIAVSVQESFTVLDVTNFGIQIPAQAQERLFDRFYRTEASRSRGVGGSGLGLAIVRAIMTQHDGYVEVSSISTNGTRFRLAFPQAA